MTYGTSSSDTLVFGDNLTEVMAALQSTLGNPSKDTNWKADANCFGDQTRRVTWGNLEVEGESERYKDAKLFPGGSRQWNWRETQTSHKPGVQIADVRELLEHGAKVVVLSRGMAECLHVPRETLDFLKEREIPVHVLPTQHAVALYNTLAQTEAVGGLFHTTC